MADHDDPSHVPAILAALAQLSDDIKEAAGCAVDDHVRRGLTTADLLLHMRAREHSSRMAPAPVPVVDEVAAARERRETAGLPSITTDVEDAGLAMTFEFGEDPPRKK
jgi:hypothetical protein